MNTEMNTVYERIKPDDRLKDKLQDALESFDHAAGSETNMIPAGIPCGDMPGDKVNICEGHIEKARVIFPSLIRELIPITDANPYGRAVVSVCGGSGVGKSGAAAVLSYMLRQAGIGSYTMSGDNYPRRIPKYNDAERLHIFRQGGMRALAGIKASTNDVINIIRELQKNDDDVNETHINEYDWFGQYLKGGASELRKYLGSPAECDYEEVDSILAAFLDGADRLWLKRMGRDEASLWYEEVDMSDTRVLVLEWTHGNSEYLKNVDIPILLNSTPEETLKYRLSRNRDCGTDSPFTTLILNIEQDKLKEQAHKAKIIVTKGGEIIDYEAYKELMR